MSNQPPPPPPPERIACEGYALTVECDKESLTLVTEGVVYTASIALDDEAVAKLEAAIDAWRAWRADLAAL